MHDVFAAIASDPVALPLWCIAIMAAAMYPVGFMIGRPCSNCCGQSQPCGVCTEGELPDTVTVTLGGYSDKMKLAPLCGLSFSSCYGSGAAGAVLEPGGDPETDAGPISSVSLTKAGSGYAKLGRVEPTLSLAVSGNGSGAEFSITLQESSDSCGLPYWKVSGVTVDELGSGYDSSNVVSVMTAKGDTAEESASITLTVPRTEPTITATVAGGTGAEISLTLAKAQAYGGGDYWYISQATIDNPGSGYSDQAQVSFDPGEGDFVLGNNYAHASALTNFTEPTVTAIPSALSYSGGSGAELEVSLSQNTFSDGRHWWSVSGVSVVSAGSGYADGQEVGFSCAGITSSPASATLEVDEDGAIVSVSVQSGGGYWNDGGTIAALNFINRGRYYHAGDITGVTISNGGKYYREDKGEQPYVADVTVSVGQSPQSNGSGAVIKAEVNKDTGSADFGKITGLTIDDGGDDYLAWKWSSNDCCGHYMNGKTIVLQRNLPDVQVNWYQNGQDFFPQPECTYSHTLCGGWQQPYGILWYGTYQDPFGTHQNHGHTVAVAYLGPTTPPAGFVGPFFYGSPEFSGSNVCGALFTTDTIVSDCGQLAFDGESTYGQTMSVTPGGEYDPEFENPGGSFASCGACCQGQGVVPQEIEIDVEDHPQDWKDSPTYINQNGRHVLTREGSAHRWSKSTRLDGYQDENGDWAYEVIITYRVNIDSMICATKPDEGGCDHCLRKCAVIISAGTTWQSEFEDTRYPACGTNKTEAQLQADKCAAVCEDTPMCQPPQGISVPLAYGGCGDVQFTISTV